jgi:hypothetical protein
MNLKDYIKGDKRGKEAHRLEREAMSDPFLQEAMDGFERVEGNHAKVITQLEKRVTSKNRSTIKQRNWLYFGSMAASILFLLGFSYYFLFVKNTQPNILIAENKISKPEPFEVCIEETVPLEMSSKERREAPVISLSESMDMFDCDGMQTDESITECKAIESITLIADEKQLTISKADLDMESVKMADESLALVESERSDYRSKEVSKQQTSVKFKETAFNKEIDEQVAFGEKEFKEYCLKKVDKNLCKEGKTKVKVSFYINEAGKPTDIKFSSFTCNEAKTEMENLLDSSPVWTERNRKVSITVEW